MGELVLTEIKCNILICTYKLLLVNYLFIMLSFIYNSCKILMITLNKPNEIIFLEKRDHSAIFEKKITAKNAY